VCFVYFVVNPIASFRSKERGKRSQHLEKYQHRYGRKACS
jgi:hypothetical protein